ncbi:two-component system response regulator [Crocosphaera chwakensis]|uniref:Putative diguanylate cyclase/phosphodiesterase (GGDEF & EAL domains) with Response Regulator Receiver modulation n=1 Tax=Crocosphaera chwakensis CCY0110 TaxID=391612 RepID=A3ITH6_9CHRO|nr:EAL domain-containing protein [Crocosphaera chwakensis]EAZ90261.1 Putative diguanylate cyclase/phosphodiesterase (GGDEF & EAL domains) with Response Regulator Receiver modulation [Crocosphaera chwakensis CCY0110]
MEKPLILVVDDNPNNIQVLFQCLKKADYKVLIAQTGESAINQAKKTLPDLILLDVMMPIMDGFETCSSLKSLPETVDIPVIFMTVLNETFNKVKGFSLGAVDYITKPFIQEELLARVKLHLDLRHLTKTLEQQNKFLKKEIKARIEMGKQLQKFNQNLEKLVEERTEELTKTLLELQTTQIQLLDREAQLKHDAFHDKLTGLINRELFVNLLKQEMKTASVNSDYLYGVLFIDLDGFKMVNDSLGHLIGDDLLKVVSQRLKTCVRSSDAVARFGGDEFAILLKNLKELSLAEVIAQRILKTLSQPFYLNNNEVAIGASIGMTFNIFKYNQATEILRDADIAMYQAKRQGKGHYQCFNPDMQALVFARLQLERELKKAVENIKNNEFSQQFSLYYQPIVHLKTRKINGFEALLRWQHPTEGWISPQKFIPIAEETQLINPLGWWILKQVCQQMSYWTKQFPNHDSLRVNINVSAIQFKQDNFVEQIGLIIQESHLPPESLKLEITESYTLNTENYSLEKLQKLKDMGIHLCIDDFGVGYSCLNRLQELPVNTLKIDRSFLQKLNQCNPNLQFVKAILMLASSLEIEVVAEGIETKTQLQYLQELGCLLGQGYLFSKPIDSNQATQFLREEKIFELC